MKRENERQIVQERQRAPMWSQGFTKHRVFHHRDEWFLNTEKTDCSIVTHMGEESLQLNYLQASVAETKSLHMDLQLETHLIHNFC